MDEPESISTLNQEIGTFRRTRDLERRNKIKVAIWELEKVMAPYQRMMDALVEALNG